jgi:hypothetical protein
MSNLVASVVSETATMTKLSSLPVIKTRSKKIEKDEKARRERKLEQQRRKDNGESPDATPGGAFSANDGSADGRRAEREKRRTEHRKENNVREKTPEEIKEMERQRRIRMTEEAERWNMAPDDAPDEGSAENDDGYDYMDEDGETNVEDFDEEEGDDVMDLD